MRKPLNALNLEKIVFLIQPLCHGNGGWYGQKVIGKMTLKKALSTCNVGWTNHSDSGGDARVRICLTEDANNARYYFDSDTKTWIDGRGKIMAMFSVKTTYSIRRVK